MARILFIAADSPLIRWLAQGLTGSQGVEACRFLELQPRWEPGKAARQAAALAQRESLETLLICPRPGRRLRFRPTAEQTGAVCSQAAQSGLRQAVLLSSSAIYPPSHHHPGHVGEAHRLRRAENALSKGWRCIEEAFGAPLQAGSIAPTVVRACPVASPQEGSFLNRLISRRLALTAAGFDPSIQLLHAEDLLAALLRAIERRAEGVYNVAPQGVIPLRKALKLTGSRRLALPYSLQRALRSLLAPLGLCAHPSHLECLRYPNTACGERIERELGFKPRFDSRQAVESLPGRKPRLRPQECNFDKFGMDRDYIQAYGRTLFRFLHRAYWRIEEEGLEHIPSRGRAVLVGVHRGFMPWDAVMLLHSIVQQTGRYPRFLIHPSLVKFPGLANYMTKLGGILASQENADWVLQRDKIVGVYPEGIRGAFTMYRDAYKLGSFGRNDFVRIALRNRAPLIPVVTVGSAEIYPILGRIDWRWWKRFSEWPFLPLTPTFPWIPLPLPSKWHTRFLAPIQVQEEFPPQAAEDPEVVQEISQRVQNCFKKTFEQMLKARRSIFYGSIFEQAEQEGIGDVEAVATRRAH